jgi:hypothetical protein
MFAIIEALTDLLFPATLLTRLVSLEIICRNERADQKLPDANRKKRGPVGHVGVFSTGEE